MNKKSILLVCALALTAHQTFGAAASGGATPGTTPPAPTGLLATVRSAIASAASYLPLLGRPAPTPSEPPPPPATPAPAALSAATPAPTDVSVAAATAPGATVGSDPASQAATRRAELAALSGGVVRVRAAAAAASGGGSGSSARPTAITAELEALKVKKLVSPAPGGSGASADGGGGGGLSKARIAEEARIIAEFLKIETSVSTFPPTTLKLALENFVREAVIGTISSPVAWSLNGEPLRAAFMRNTYRHITIPDKITSIQNSVTEIFKLCIDGPEEMCFSSQDTYTVAIDFMFYLLNLSNDDISFFSSKLHPDLQKQYPAFLLMLQKRIIVALVLTSLQKGITFDARLIALLSHPQVKALLTPKAISIATISVSPHECCIALIQRARRADRR